MPAQRSIEQARVFFAQCLNNVQYTNYRFKVQKRQGCLYLQAEFIEDCAREGLPNMQHTRQWLLHPDMTNSEFVQTAFKLVLTSVEHEARENFKYRGKAIFGPHFNVDTLHAVSNEANLEHRKLAA